VSSKSDVLETNPVEIEPWNPAADSNNVNDPDYDPYGREVAEKELLNDPQLAHGASGANSASTEPAPVQRFYNALVLYNLAALYFRQRTHQQKALQTMNDAIAELKAYISIVNTARETEALCSLHVPMDRLELQFLERPGAMNIPFCIS
jgi:hypothetical protein